MPENGNSSDDLRGALDGSLCRDVSSREAGPCKGVLCGSLRPWVHNCGIAFPDV